MANLNERGGQWTEQEKKAVWVKGSSINGLDASLWRSDVCGKSMKYSEFGNRSSDYGWEIDHINPISNGGHDYISNLQPLNWKTNSAKADTVNWKCA